ncbi:PREDICTED: methylesterase 1-like [Tarenaya hassleriana]|uniref:methylesterase 1-like n=1 Tax=Tarenaya hassleriana TaxID=28532 RepID=UPI00053C8570|nr:PREDICTED: methylesterase 1-like [Tarenaya hassleriana]
MEEANKKHHFVLVHGACQGAWCWYKVKPRLEEAGHRVTVMDLAGSGIDVTRTIKDVNTCVEYSDPLIKILGSSPPSEKVVLVGHSFGGMSLAIASEKFPDKISVSVYLTAFMPDTKNPPSFVIDKILSNMPEESWMGTKFERYGHDKTGISMLYSPELMKKKLYKLCPVEDLELALSLLRPGSLFTNALSKMEKFSEKGYGSVRRVFIMCKGAKAMAEEQQRWIIENSGASEVIEMEDTGHMAMICKPRQVSAHLLEIADKYA